MMRMNWLQWLAFEVISIYYQISIGPVNGSSIFLFCFFLFYKTNKSIVFRGACTNSEMILVRTIKKKNDSFSVAQRNDYVNNNGSQRNNTMEMMERKKKKKKRKIIISLESNSFISLIPFPFQQANRTAVCNQSKWYYFYIYFLFSFCILLSLSIFREMNALHIWESFFMLVGVHVCTSDVLKNENLLL